MSLRPGDYAIGPPASRLRLRTYRQGLASKAGHDLVLEAAEWHGTVSVPSEPDAGPTVVVEVDLRRLEVLEGSGGVKPLTEGDKRDIHKAMQKPLKTHEHPIARFSSTEASVDGDTGTITGDLTLAGQTHALELRVDRASDGAVTGTGQVVQTAWGIKPYTGFLGALKLRDTVDVELSVQLGD